MRNQFLSCALLSLLALPLQLLGQPGLANVELEIQPVAGDVYMIQ